MLSSLNLNPMRLQSWEIIEVTLKCCLYIEIWTVQNICLPTIQGILKFYFNLNFLHRWADDLMEKNMINAILYIFIIPFFHQVVNPTVGEICIDLNFEDTLFIWREFIFKRLRF